METQTKRFSFKRFTTAMMAVVMLLGGLPGYVPTVHADSKTTLTFDIKDGSGNAVNDASIKLEWYDDNDEDWYEISSPESYGVYKVFKDTKFRYTITKDAISVDGNFETEYEDEKTINVSLVQDSADMTKLKAIKAKLDAESTLKPVFSTDKNINTYLLNKIKGYTNVTSTGVSVALKSSEDYDWIATDGKINYKNSYNLNNYSTEQRSKTVGCVFTLSAGNETLDTGKMNFTIGWDIDYVNSQIEAERDAFTIDDITSSEITGGFSLPEYTNGGASTSWSSIAWTSSNENVISIADAADYNNKFSATINPQAADTKVTLTATFSIVALEYGTDLTGANKKSDFRTYTKDFEVTVKGKGASTSKLESALNELIKVDTNGKFVHIFSDQNKTKPLDPKSVTTSKIYFDKAKNVDTDIGSNQLYASYDGTDNLFICGSSNSNKAYIRPSNGGYVDVTVPSDGSKKGKLKLIYEKEGLKASVEVELTVVSAGEAKKHEALELMEFAKAHFWEAVNDNLNTSKDDVKKGLHAFYEINKDANGNLVVCYDQNKMTNTGIKVQGYFDGNNMGAEGYNQFKSSDPDVIKHNLVMADTLPEYNTEVTISCILSSCEFETQAKQNPTDPTLSKLANQEVSVTVTVKGPKGEAPAGQKGPHKDIDVLLTIADKGNVVKANDGSYMAQKRVHVRNLNNDKKITLDEALVCAHEQFNSRSGYETEGAAVMKLWGVSTKNTGYVKNNSFTKAVTEVTVEENDKITAFIYSDDVVYSDKYTYFDETEKSLETGTEATLTLSGINGNTNFTCAGVKVVALDGKELGTTDSNGQVKISFNNPGTYAVASEGTVRVGGEDCQVVPATCIVTVTGDAKPDPGKPETDPVGDTSLKVKSIKLNKSSAKINIGETVALTAKINPSNAGYKWTTSNPEVASITPDGKGVIVTGRAKGTAKITAISIDGKKKAKCRITVQGPTEPKSVSIKKKGSSIDAGKTMELTAKISPKNAVNAGFTWESLTPDIASVAGNGEKAVVTGLKGGKAKIRVTTANGKHKDVKITVKGPVEAKNVSIKKKSSKVEIGKTVELTAKVTPDKAVDKSVTWECLTPAFAKLDVNGNKATLTGLAAGKAKVRVTTANGKKKVVTINVKAHKK